jgi:DNA invertase Pin-like site-specific DNA recombinase
MQPTGKVIAYYRVSTKKQGESGLGLKGQVAAVAAFAAQQGAEIIKEYTEVETGKRSDRAELAAALRHARATRATIVIAKLDRLARNVAFTSQLMESKVPFVACDNPHANRLTIHILAALAEHEAGQISERTKAALGAYRSDKRIPKRLRQLYPEGVPPEVADAVAGKLGAELPQCRNLNPEARAVGSARGVATRRARAAELAAEVGPVAAELRASGLPLRAVAAELNARGYVTTARRPYTAVAVLRLINRGG